MIMFISASILIAWFMVCPFVCTDSGSKRPPDSVYAAQMNDSTTIEEIIGPERSRLISKASRIRIYRLKPFTTESLERQKRKKYLENYEVLVRKRLDSKRVSQMKSALLNSGAYLKDDVNKCTFAATIGFEIVYKKERLIVITSYPCKKLLFLRRGEELYRDLRTLDPLHHIARDLFKDLPEPE